MDVIFVDVGFGSSSVILTGSGEAIVIDAGDRLDETLLVLNSYSVKRISHLIISHWHDDHVGGATALMKAFTGNVGSIWFPFDDKFKKTDFWDFLVKQKKLGNITNNQIKPLLIENDLIWESAKFDADLKIVSPCFMENNEGVASGDSNSTCGIILLRVGTKIIVFAGDATLRQWEGVTDRVGGAINAEIISVPHHAGIMWPSQWNDKKIAAALDVLYSKKVVASHGIISASTLPGVKHPREDVIAALVRAKVSVMCTQMTSRCTSNLETVRTLRKSLPLAAPGRSSIVEVRSKRTNKSYDVACAGSVFVELSATGAKIHYLNEHRSFTGKLPNKSGKLPMCKR